MRIWVSIAAALMIIGCDVPGTASATPSPSRPTTLPSPLPSPISSPVPSPTPIPDPSPTVFIQFTQSDYGAIAIQTQPGAACNASGTRPDGSAIGGIRNPQVAADNGSAQWVYPQTATSTGTGQHNVSCSWQGQSTSFSASFGVGN